MLDKSNLTSALPLSISPLNWPLDWSDTSFPKLDALYLTLKLSVLNANLVSIPNNNGSLPFTIWKLVNGRKLAETVAVGICGASNSRIAGEASSIITGIFVDHFTILPGRGLFFNRLPTPRPEPELLRLNKGDSSSKLISRDILDGKAFDSLYPRPRPLPLLPRAGTLLCTLFLAVPIIVIVAVPGAVFSFGFSLSLYTHIVITRDPSEYVLFGIS